MKSGGSSYAIRSWKAVTHPLGHRCQSHAPPCRPPGLCLACIPSVQVRNRETEIQTTTKRRGASTTPPPFGPFSQNRTKLSLLLFPLRALTPRVDSDGRRRGGRPRARLLKRLEAVRVEFEAAGTKITTFRTRRMRWIRPLGLPGPQRLTYDRHNKHTNSNQFPMRESLIETRQKRAGKHTMPTHTHSFTLSATPESNVPPSSGASHHSLACPGAQPDCASITVPPHSWLTVRCRSFTLQNTHTPHAPASPPPSYSLGPGADGQSGRLQ